MIRKNARSSSLLKMAQPKERTIVTKIRLRDGSMANFNQWLTELHSQILLFDGLVSLEMISLAKTSEWVIVQRFNSDEHAHIWRDSKEYSTLLEILKDYPLEEVREAESQTYDQRWGVTEIFVTTVNADKTEDYRTWVRKIYEVESQFPGFRGVYVQSPPSGQRGNWITLLQFDSQKHLDQWLGSKERRKILKDSESLVQSLESHRVISPFAGWFASASIEGKAPEVWKQTCLVLLVLFPIVILELKFLLPYLQGLNPVLATFISNAISVTLVSWPMMPLAIYFLKWWLTPNPNRPLSSSIGGIALLLVLYCLEITILWPLLP